VETVAAEMGAILGWDNNEQKRQVKEYKKYISLRQRYKAAHKDK
jgi:hypothetical protein